MITVPFLLAAFLFVWKGIKDCRYLTAMAAVPIFAGVFLRHQIAALLTTVSNNELLVVAGYDPVLPLPAYFRTYVTAVVGYVLPKFVVPVGSSIDPDIQTVPAWYSLEFIFALCMIATLAAAAIFLKGDRRLLLRLGILAILISPVSTYAVFPLADVIQEHRFYMAGLGVAMLCAWLAQWLHDRYGTRAVLATAAVAAVFAFMTFQRNQVWATNVTLWQDAVQKSPGKARPHINLGQAYHANGYAADALREYQAVLKLRP